MTRNTTNGGTMLDLTFPYAGTRDGCDSCGRVLELSHFEGNALADGAALCDDCYSAAADLPDTPPERDPLGFGVVVARRAETDARLLAERLEREAAAAVDAWNVATAVRVRAECWKRADELRAELADVEARAARVSKSNPNGDGR